MTGSTTVLREPIVTLIRPWPNLMDKGWMARVKCPQVRKLLGLMPQYTYIWGIGLWLGWPAATTLVEGPRVF